MVRILSSLIMIIPAIFLIYSCQLNPNANSSQANQPGQVKSSVPVIPSIQGLDDLLQGAYVGGSMIYSTNETFCNLLAGTRIQIRMDRIQYYYDPVLKENTGTPIESSAKYGYVYIISADESQVTFQYILYNNDGSIYQDVKNVTLKANESYNLDNDGTDDVAYIPYKNTGYPAREGLEDSVLFMFLSSQKEGTRTLYYLKPDNYKDYAYPGGILNIKPNGKLIIGKDMSGTAVGQTSGSVSFDKSKSPQLVAGDFIIGQKESILGEVYSVSRTISTIQASYTNVIGKDAFDTMYFRIKGSVSELNTMYNQNRSPTRSYDLQFLHHRLSFSMEFDYNTSTHKFDSPKISASFKSLSGNNPINNNLKVISNKTLLDEYADLSNKSEAGGQFTISVDDDVYGDFYIDVKVDTGWIYLKGFFESYISLSNTTTLGLVGAITYSYNREQQIFAPGFSFAIGWVPVYVSFPLYLGVNFSATGQVALSTSVMIYGKIGFHVDYNVYYSWFKIHDNTSARPISDFQLKPNYPTIIGDISATLKPYLALRPNMSIAYLIGPALNAVGYMSGTALARAALSTANGIALYFDTSLHAGFSLDGGISLGISGVWSRYYSLGTIYSHDWTLLRYTNSHFYSWSTNCGDLYNSTKPDGW